MQRRRRSKWAPRRRGSPRWSRPDETVEPEAANGTATLLFDHQVRVGSGKHERFARVVERIVNESGLQSASQLDVAFDPSFEALTLHSVTVRRGGETLDRLNRGAIRLVQREKDLDAQVYDGRVSAVLFIEDLRVGDVVESAYTVAGADPTLGGRYADALFLGAPKGIARVHHRVLLPKARRVLFAALGPAVPGKSASPATRDVGDETEYVWDWLHVPAFPIERDAPPSFQPLPWVEVTEFASWNEVAQLGSQLFDVGGVRTPSLKRWAETARAEASTPEQYLLRASRFVQDEIRYVAVEVGMARRRPTDPGTVFDRRYGDCKDKAALLVALLRRGGVEARPALVSTTAGRTLDALAPSPLAFDHAIVHGKIGDNDYWVDATVALQGGGVDRLRFSGFDRALVLDPARTALDDLRREPGGEASPYVRDEFRVSAPGAAEDTSLDTVRVYRGAFADVMRGVLRSVTKDHLQKDVLQRYQREYPDIREAGPVQVVDQRELNYLRIEGHFKVPGFWAAPQQGKPYAATFVARLLDDALGRPTTSDRTAPLGLPYPYRVRYEVEASLPFDLTMDPQSEEVSTASFTFHFNARSALKHLHYAFELSTGEPEVSASDLGSHLAAMDRMSPFLARTLTYRAPLPDGPNWPILGALAVAAAACAWGARRAYLYNPAPTLAVEPDPKLAGIRGWLILLAFNVAFLPPVLAWNLFAGARLVVSRTAWSALSTPGEPAYSPARVPVILIEVLSQTALTAYACAVAVAFVRRRQGFRVHFPALLVSSLVFAVLDHAAVGILSLGSPDSARIGRILWGAFWGCVWIAYVRYSPRVRATFAE